MFKRSIRYFSCGFLIGLANLVPGVSGGTIAVILNIYEDLIKDISDLFSKPKSVLFKNQRLITIGIGAIVAIFTCSQILEWLLTDHEETTLSFFTGLIAGSIPMVFRSHKDMSLSISRGVFFTLPLMSLILLSIIAPSSVSTHPLILGISGFLAASSMIVPGLSGSLVLLIMGTYQSILEAVSLFNIQVIGIVGIGAIFGIALTSKFIKWSFEKWPSHSYFCILGLLCGSIITLFPPITSFFSIGWMIIGLILSLAVSK